MRKTVSMFVACMMLVAIASTAHATVFTVYATDGGWFTENGWHQSVSDNYLTGVFQGGEYRSFFTFDIPALDGSVVSAVLQAPNPDVNSVDPNETYTVYDYTLPNSLHIDYFFPTGVPIFLEFGGGTSYGSALVNATPPTDPVVVALNASGRGDISAAQGSEFALGGAITTLSGTGASEYIFSLSQGWQLSPGTGDDPVLIITTRTGPQEPIIPEPATLALLGAGLLATVRRRRRK
jgi:hypothetical protein